MSCVGQILCKVFQEMISGSSHSPSETSFIKSDNEILIISPLRCNYFFQTNLDLADEDEDDEKVRASARCLLTFVCCSIKKEFSFILFMLTKGISL